MDADVEVKLKDCCYYTICTCWTCCNDCDYQCWSIRITYRKICHRRQLPTMIRVLHVMNVREKRVAQVSAEIIYDLWLELQVQSRDLWDEEVLGVVKISER